MKLVLAILLLCAVLCSARAPLVEQKKPERSREAIRKATTMGLSGYQGSSVTKNAKPRQPKPRKPVVEQKTPKRPPEAVRKATKAGLAGYQGKSTTKK
ncbi:hypothetical protein AB1Y20_007093 [Prymnesium parvum]|uniref:Uncharacterized protein n=1 Tax=Prymnesium parvum TaxID=97485 RepID=A0AB34J277_PRYPA|mmetsp:Transcript_1216/g.3083  ORF Transcript_1216/g.3083 Transcript_1216/m.3083 type:complete len:98 (+) Transcript_1216:43-336(+)